MVQYFLRTFRPSFYGWLTRLIYSSKNVSFGKKLRCDSIPKILIDENAQLRLGNQVELRRNLELRVHQNAKIIIGDNVRVDRGVRLLATNSAVINLANGVRIGLYSVLNGGDDIWVGERSLISGFVYLQTSMHGFKDKNKAVQKQGYSHAPVKLEEDTWLGTHVVVLPGVTLAKGVVVGSNAVVTKSAAAYTILGGVPARVLNERK
jgi:acetyltransferase-like isoleucine patch superfamily enzyme